MAERFPLSCITAGTSLRLCAVCIQPIVAESAAVFMSALFTDGSAFTGGVAAGVGFREKVSVAVIAVGLMACFAFVLIVHLMLSDAAIVMIALLAVGLAPTERSPAIVMRRRDLCAANAGTSAGVVVHIRPNVAMSCFIFSFRASRAGMIMRISTVSPPGLPGMPESIAVWLLASCADSLCSTGCCPADVPERFSFYCIAARTSFRLCAIRIQPVMPENTAVCFTAFFANWLCGACCTAMMILPEIARR